MAENKFIEEEEEEAEEGAPMWMVTFSDMVTLLLTFFVLLLSFANTDAQKFKEMLGSVKDAFGVQTEKLGEFEEKFETFIQGRPNILDTKEHEKLLFFQEIRKIITEKKLGGSTDLEMEKDGIRLRIRGQTLFATGSAELSPDMFDMLDQIKMLLDKFDYTLIVEGHTDNIPIKSTIYPSNWELSSARAISVIRYFMEKLQVASNRLMAVGYADTKPLADNNTAENRAKNRRVEFKFEQQLLKSYQEKVAQPKLIQFDIFEREKQKRDVLKQFQDNFLDKAKDMR